MTIKIIVCTKQVMDPETPASAFNINPSDNTVMATPGIPPVVNGFDEIAVQAALRIKDTQGADITVLSAGDNFVMDIMKKPLSMGADQMTLIDDPLCQKTDAFGTARILAAAIKKIGAYDLILCGRQASDWDNAHVPIGIAEFLELPCITVAQSIEITKDGVVVERTLTTGYEVVEASLPAVVTITNELGEPRYPTLRGIMSASRKSPTVWSTCDIGLDATDLTPKVKLIKLYLPPNDQDCVVVEGEDESDAGRNLALLLRQEKLI